MTVRGPPEPYRERVPSVSRGARIFDAALAVVITAVGVAEIWVPFSSVQGQGSRVTSTLLVVLAGLPLAVRRSHPLPVLLVITLSWPVVYSVTPVLVLFFGTFVPLGVALFSVARYGRGRAPLYGALATAALLLFLDLRVAVMQEPGEIVFHWGVCVLVWLSGWALRRTADRAAAAMQQTIAVEVAAAERTMAAVVEERSRIARELHDVVAHAVSMMVVQAGAAEQVVDDDPAFVRGALETIRSTGRDALVEMRRVLALLRDQDEAGALQPQPGVAALGALVDSARAAGLDVLLEVQGDQRELPAGLDLAAYRIVQEALTNVRRHASASRASVRLCFTDDEVRVEVADDGRGVATGTPREGNGLIGMRERAGLYGGRLETTSADGRGFTVIAVLPVAPA